MKNGTPRSSKGSGGELEVAKLLQSWWREIDPQAKFVRVPRSGGWMYGAEFGACGDVMAKSNPPFPFAIEVKRKEAWTIKRLVAGQPSPVWEWWRQCQHDAARVSKEPMLWFRKNRQPWHIMLRRAYIAGLRINPPDHAWRKSLRYAVDCQEIPVLYITKGLLPFSPQTFLPNQIGRP